jgi:drug/metabolite transporter (DMT)-like permease
VTDPLPVPVPPGHVGSAPGADTARGRPGSAALVVLAVALFSLNAGTSAVVLRAGVTPEALAAVRALGTAAVLGLALLGTGRVRTLAVPRRQWPWILLYGAGGVTLVQWAYFVAIDRLPIGLALLLEYLAPLVIALVARFWLRRPVSRLVWPALALALGGLALATRVPGGGLDPVGIAAGLGAAGAFAVYFLVGERLVTERDALSTTFWGFAVAAVASAVLAAPELPAAARLSSETAALPAAAGGASVPVWGLLAVVVLLGTLAPFAAVTAALRRLPATLVSIIGTGEVVGAAAVAWWWFGQTLSAVQVAGFALVVSGVVLALLARGIGEAGPPGQRARALAR